ncbi:uncharacterized protein LOC144876106 [Branchiostoma floridae x Branchiostoma japonicum]
MTTTSTITRMKTTPAIAMNVSMATVATTAADRILQQRSTTWPGKSSSSFNGAIIGGAVAAGVVILIIAVVVFIFCVRRRQSRGTEAKQSAPQPDEMDRNSITGPHISDEGEYVDTLPSNVNSQQTGTDNGGYENIPMDASVALHQSGSSGNIYENVPRAPPSGQYEELHPAVYQSLQI